MLWRHVRLRRRKLWKIFTCLLISLLIGWTFFIATLFSWTDHDVAGKHAGPISQERRDKTTAKVNVMEILETMNERSHRVQEACDGGMRRTSKQITNHTLVSRMHHLIYCPVEKVASTFWRRFLYQLEYTDLMESPFDVSVQKAFEGLTNRVKIFEKGERLNRLLQFSTKVLFVRDPYTRLFSAYVDKLFSPNPFFWKIWGAQAVSKYRSGGVGLCGSDVTFQEFVNLVTDQEWAWEPHVMPITRMCDPCRMNYTVIGKLETFARDTRLVLAYLGFNDSHAERLLSRIGEDTHEDAVRDSWEDAMSEGWMNLTLRCVSKTEAVRRIWRKLQLRGIISWRMNFDLSPHYVSKMAPSDYVRLLLKAVRESSRWDDLVSQKRQALLEALKSLKPWQLAEIKRVYAPDFQLFGYNSSKLLALLPNIALTGAFDWRKNWDMSIL